MRGIVVACILTLTLTPALAAEARVDWPTFFRAGPSRQDAVLDELLRGTRLEVRSCDGEWCQVQHDRAMGYVQRSALNAVDSLPFGVAPGTDCFESRRAGYGKGEVFRFCRR